MKTRIAFLDRDGTLVETDIRRGMPVPRHHSDRAILLPGVSEGCRRLRAAGFLLVLVTNQPDIARGLVTRAQVAAVNQQLQSLLGLDLVMVCEHDDHHTCRCRKPKPGLLFQAAQAFDVPLSADSVLIGDRWRDVGAGQAAGVRTILVGSGYEGEPETEPDFSVQSFSEAVNVIVSMRRET